MPANTVVGAVRRVSSRASSGVTAAAITAVLFAAGPCVLHAQRGTPAPRATQVPIAGSMGALGSPVNPRVVVAWNRFYDHAAIGEICRRMAAAHPDRVKCGSIGKSTEGREMWLLTVTNFATGNPSQKPAMYIDGNIHSNEIQGSEFSLYTAWYLAEMADEVPSVNALLDQRVLYIVPTINPDARDHYIHQPNTANSPRSGLSPRDSDGDGVIDEDGYDDLNGDGHITQMRRRNPNGRFKVNPENARALIPIIPGETGEWEVLGLEGIDNDDDGRVNEDADGGYDPNRNWAWRWAPQYVQNGADMYPGSLVETRNIKAFVNAHPNIAGAQSYHNSGGMILRGPGVPQDEYRPADVAVFDQLGRTGEKILPGYRYMTVWKDLYTAWGGELDWFYGARGILTFSNELFTPFLYFSRPVERGDGGRYGSAQADFDRLLLMNEASVEWTPVKHPQYGDIEVGGFKKNFGRVEPGFLLEMDAHRNMMFTLYQTDQLPLVEVDSVMTRSLGGGLTEVTAIIANRRLAPTHTQQDIDNRINRPDWISLTGAPVVAGFVVTDVNQDVTEEQPRNPARIAVESIGGNDVATVRWIVRGNGPFTVTVDSPKGGVHSMRSR